MESSKVARPTLRLRAETHQQLADLALAAGVSVNAFVEAYFEYGLPRFAAAPERERIAQRARDIDAERRRRR